jgi:hypothetical protein
MAAFTNAHRETLSALLSSRAIDDTQADALHAVLVEVTRLEQERDTLLDRAIAIVDAHDTWIAEKLEVLRAPETQST